VSRLCSSPDWNDFPWPLIFTNPTRNIRSAGIVNLSQHTVACKSRALSIVASLPTLFVFLFFQRYFIRHDHGRGEG
jgi:ABC-type glycerol-3-phosphate transport system permease component